MKKRLVTFLFVIMVAFSFTVPVMAVDAVFAEPVSATGEQGITPATEMTRMFFRTVDGQLQWRLWSLTNGRWLTDWANV
jgi:hypothetical protein